MQHHIRRRVAMTHVDDIAAGICQKPRRILVVTVVEDGDHLRPGAFRRLTLELSGGVAVRLERIVRHQRATVGSRK